MILCQELKVTGRDLVKKLRYTELFARMPQNFYTASAEEIQAHYDITLKELEHIVGAAPDHLFLDTARKWISVRPKGVGRA